MTAIDEIRSEVERLHHRLTFWLCLMIAWQIGRGVAGFHLHLEDMERRAAAAPKEASDGK